MFELDVERSFSAAHNLRGYNGQCSEKHGHNWGVRVTVRASELDAIGISVDFRALKKELDALLLCVDHKDLNQVPPFDSINPTSENLARYFFDRLSARFNDGRCRVWSVRVSEGAGSGCTCFGEEK